tara:strand:+ start:666 stop:863 length:198 start_codon:yes stop_codon:yes gene_type:complete
MNHNMNKKRRQTIDLLKEIAKWMEESDINYTEKGLDIALDQVKNLYMKFLKENYNNMWSRTDKNE